MVVAGVRCLVLSVTHASATTGNDQARACAALFRQQSVRDLLTTDRPYRPG